MNYFSAIFFVLILLFGCSPRYIKYQRSKKKVLRKEITQEQFDEKFFAFYNDGKSYSSDSLLSIKFKGCYVNQDKKGNYSIYKFLKEGKVIDTQNFKSYPDNLALLDVRANYYYYQLNSDLVEVEYLSSRDWSLYNLVMTGQSRNDSIIFYQVKNQQLPFSKFNSIRKVYVYDSTLTMTPIIR